MHTRRWASKRSSLCPFCFFRQRFASQRLRCTIDSTSQTIFSLPQGAPPILSLDNRYTHIRSSEIWAFLVFHLSPRFVLFLFRLLLDIYYVQQIPRKKFPRQPGESTRWNHWRKLQKREPDPGIASQASRGMVASSSKNGCDREN